MTRYVDQGSTEGPAVPSVEIPEAAVEAAAQAIWEHDGPTEFAWPPSEEVCADAEANRKLARSALAAALPYLVPAEPEDTRTEEEKRFVEEALKAADSGSAGHWPTVAGYLADEVRRFRSVPQSAPVDREALRESISVMYGHLGLELKEEE